jgi:F-type H+-transporting ATPase subunit b
MLIDWFTVGAQVVNFLILVWLMKRFLYRPILDAVEKRRKEIASALAEAEADKERARAERDEFHSRKEDFERQRAGLLEEARTRAAEERRRLMEEAREEAEEARARQRDALERERQSLGEDIARRTREEVFAIAGRALEDLAGSDLEKRIGEVFAGRLRNLDEQTREDLAAAMRASSGPVVRSAFDLSEATRSALADALNETFGVEATYRTEPDMSGGFEILFGHRKLAWSIDGHLEDLRKSVEGMLAGNEASPAAPREAGP